MPRRKYKSGLEKKAGKILKGWKYESVRLPYTTSHHYVSDFSRQGKMILIETKGRFRTSQEAAKYIAVRKCNPEYEIVFCFGNPKTPMPNAKRRKDGTKRTVSEWAEHHNFRWCTLETIKEIV